MKSKILLTTLENCKICKEVKRLLDEYGIPYTEIPCEKDPTVCDQLEALTNSTRYPMAIIKDMTQNKDTVYFMTNDYIQLDKENIIDDRVTTIGVFSSHSIVNNILKKIK
jgi:arsenate reductase-like glutaredoxin family protein